MPPTWLTLLPVSLIAMKPRQISAEQCHHDICQRSLYQVPTWDTGSNFFYGLVSYEVLSIFLFFFLNI